MQRKFTMAFHTPGTGVDQAIYFTVSSDCQLVHVSAVASNSNTGKLIIGDSGDDNEYLTSQDIGDSNVPNEFDGADFVDTDGNTHPRYYPRIVDGTIVVITVDTDGAVSGTADDLTLVLTFVEG